MNMTNVIVGKELLLRAKLLGFHFFLMFERSNTRVAEELEEILPFGQGWCFMFHPQNLRSTHFFLLQRRNQYTVSSPSSFWPQLREAGSLCQEIAPPMQIRLETKADKRSSQCRDRRGEKMPSMLERNLFCQHFWGWWNRICDFLRY